MQFVPGLAHNLLSVDKLLSSGYSVMFTDNTYIIRDSKTGVQLAIIQRTCNNMFPMDANNIGSINAAENVEKSSMLWHMRYNHLNFTGLKWLKEKKMVEGLPDIVVLNHCEECISGKQAKMPFPSSGAHRAVEGLQLVHVDICGPM